MINNENDFTKKELQNGTKALLSKVSNLDDFCSLFASSNTSSKNKRDTTFGCKLLYYACMKTIDDSFFDQLLRLVQECIQNQDFVPEAAFVENDEQQQLANISMDDHAKRNLRLLQHAAVCVQTRFLSNKPKKNHHDESSSVWQLCVELHNALHDIDPAWGESATSASNAIVSLCEGFYLNNNDSNAVFRHKRNEVILHALPALVEGALQTKSDLKRLYAVREALTLIDFESDESKPFASLLLRLVSIPSCLKAAEGKRLLSYLIRIGLCRQIHRSIRAQIPGNKPSILTDYGDIYYQAWKDSSDDDQERELVELEIYQDLAYALIHAAKHQLVKSILNVMEPLHRHQNKTEVETFLHRLYGPLLWRALSAANERVRANAVQILGQVFPLRPPAVAKSETENPLERAFAALESALHDEAPLVRTEASAATARVLTNFWNVIPPRDIRKLLNCLVVQHASDSSSVAVRAGAVNAIAQILETPSSHAILRELLPPLGNLIHDKAEKVRSAVVKLLQRIKKVPNIKYYKIVPVNHLMARLVEETKTSSSVASALTELMVNSYAPETATVEELVGRTHKFLTDYPRAAPTFYTNLRKFRSPSFVCQLVVGLYHCLAVAVEELETQTRALVMRKDGKRSRAEHHVKETVDDVDVVFSGTLVHVILVLWTSIKTDLDQSPEWLDFVASEIEGQSLIDMVTFFDQMASQNHNEDDQSSDVWNHGSKILLQCAALLPRSAVDSLAQALPTDPDAPKSPAYLALMSVWGVDIGRELAISVASVFNDSQDTIHSNTNPNSKKRRSEDSKETSSISQMKPLDAVRVVGAILQGDDPSSRIARDSLVRCDSLFDTLQKASQCALQILSGEVVSLEIPIGDEKSFLLEASESFGRFILHREADLFVSHEILTLSPTALMFLDWASELVCIASDIRAQKISLPFSDPNLSSIKVDPSFVASPLTTTIAGTSQEQDDSIAMGPNYHDPHTMAETLVASSCILISEWLTVGGPGGDDFAAKACDWCKAAPTMNLLLPYGRLAIQLAKQSDNTSLIKTILNQYNDELDDASSEIVRNAVSFVLTSRAKQETIQSVVEDVLSVALASLGQFRFDATAETAFSVDSIWPFEGGAVKAALAAILRSVQGSKELASKISSHISNFTGNSQEVCFLVHFLGMLCRFGSKARGEATAAMLALDRVSLPDDARDLWDEFVDQIENATG